MDVTYDCEVLPLAFPPDLPPVILSGLVLVLVERGGGYRSVSGSNVSGRGREEKQSQTGMWRRNREEEREESKEGQGGRDTGL